MKPEPIDAKSHVDLLNQRHPQKRSEIVFKRIMDTEVYDKYIEVPDFQHSEGTKGRFQTCGA